MALLFANTLISLKCITSRGGRRWRGGGAAARWGARTDAEWELVAIRMLRHNRNVLAMAATGISIASSSGRGAACGVLQSVMASLAEVSIAA